MVQDTRVEVAEEMLIDGARDILIATVPEAALPIGLAALAAHKIVEWVMSELGIETGRVDANVSTMTVRIRHRE